MKLKIFTIPSALFVLFIATACISKKEVNVPNLKEETVLQIAKKTAKGDGVDLSKYNMTGCHFECHDQKSEWTIFYEIKPPTPPGGHFIVVVDDKSKNAMLARGE